MGPNFASQGNQVVSNNPSVQMMPNSQPTGQSVNNPNMPIQVKLIFNIYYLNYLFLSILLIVSFRVPELEMLVFDLLKVSTMSIILKWLENKTWLRYISYGKL